MPLYEYECDACGERFEVIQKSFSDPPPDSCAKCGKGPVRRLISSPAIQFKGSGFYITDYAQKAKAEGGSGSKGKSDESKTETKSEGKTEGKTERKTESTASKETGAKDNAPAASTATPKKD